MITVKNLTKRYKNINALNGININVKKGEIYGFIGKNGAGKSTTMNIITGLAKMDEGDVLVNGYDLKSISHPGKLNLGYLPEEPKFYPWLTAIETLQYLGNEQNSSKERINQILEWGGLSDVGKRKVAGFSRGMKQRLGMCCALLNDPDILILDEPSSALDPQGRSDVLNLIIDLKRMGKTVIFSSHILSDVERVCDSVGIIAAGKTIMEKPLSELKKEYIHPYFDIQITNQNKNIEKITELEKLENIIKVEKNESLVSIQVNDSALASKQITKFLFENAIATESFVLRKSTLEDIFIEEVNKI